jgi:hypothetical protein
LPVPALGRFCGQLGNAPKLRHLWGMSGAKPTGEKDESAAPIKPASPERVNEPREIGGPKGPEPTRYGDWERNGRCTDF